MEDDLEQSSASSLDERIAKLSHVGPWELGKVIGRGGQGIVHIAKHKITGQEVAIKIISTEAIWNSQLSITANAEEASRAVQSIEREIVIMKLIEHPNVLSLLDVWEAKGLLFVVMEYVDGGEFSNYFGDRQRLPVSEALHHFQQIMYGVAYCHRFHVAHRDLKMENILMDKEGNIKIADFGMAIFTPRDSLLYTSCGSPHYASPEVVFGLPYNGYMADVWSCGVILYAMLSGQLPFGGESLRSILDQVREARYVIPIDVPWPAQNLIRRMMEKDVERRITVAEILIHPFFQSVPPISPPVILPTFADLACTVPRQCGNRSIDREILKNMRILWSNRQDGDIVRAIRNNGENWEKIAYHLLCEFRTKRLRCIDASGEGDMLPRRRRRCRKYAPGVLPGDTSVANGDISVAEDSPLRVPERPSAPTPLKARWRTVTSGFFVGDDPTVLDATVPLTPHKKTKTASNSSSSDVPEIVVQNTTPGTAAACLPVDNPLGSEDANTRFFKYSDPRSYSSRVVSKVEPSVALVEPGIQEDIFFQQIDEMLANMSKQDEPERKDCSHPNLRAKGLRVPASEVPPPPPPTTPTTPPFDEVDTFGNPSQNASPTIRVVKRAGVLAPSNGIRHGQSSGSKRDSSKPALCLLDNTANPPRSILNKPTAAKENVLASLAGSSSPFESRRRAMTLSVEHGQMLSGGRPPPKKRVHIVTPDPSVFERPRRKSQPASEVEPRSSENWFSHLFQLKSNRQEFHSLHDVFSTRERCISALRAFGAHVEVGEPLPRMYGGSTLRCSLDEIVDPSGTIAVTKALKFRVEIRPTTGVHYTSGYLSELVFVQEKGPSASFNALCARLRRAWELSVTYQPDGSMDLLTLTTDSALTSPVLTVGGRYAEE